METTSKVPEGRAVPWVCESCGYRTEIDYVWVAEHGNPICGKCDEPMVADVADHDTILFQSRVWTCGECGERDAISYGWLIENGLPICTKCDADMLLENDVDHVADDE